ncbi:OLC1v1018021C1 [Oldenlandia corymbosa var. corymbosa]|uniref:OLC1v1018021C1 n=1 Tax=Oldenlandia corymbosa var. corymbosa TaxID=529605 RepID=A0AAV1EAQ2_OLDCO|nr:OLC1v1018021C1 [Oldenlandia corymbosa var. corymbosa]
MKSLKRDNDGSIRGEVSFKEIPERRKGRSSPDHLECRPNIQKMETECKEKMPVISSALLNFRRFKKERFNSYACSVDDEQQVISSRFFKAITQGFREELKLPKDFSRSLGREIPDDAILISSKGMWAVEVSRCSCHGQLVLSGDNWTLYIDQHYLDVGDQILFEQTDPLVFRTYVFDESSCEKKFHLPGHFSRMAGLDFPSELLRNGIVKSRCYENQFAILVEDHHVNQNYLSIPAEFQKLNDGLKGKERAVIVNGQGNAWEMEIVCYSDDRLREGSQRNRKLRNGWRAFFTSNKVKAGDVCVFELDPSSSLRSFTSIVLMMKIVRFM